MLVDARGERLTPSHAVKKGRRYRYYVSAALITDAGTDHFINTGIAAASHGLEEPVGVQERLPGTLASNVLALERGASVFRVHDVAPAREALAVAAATLGSTWPARSTTKTPTS